MLNPVCTSVEETSDATHTTHEDGELERGEDEEEEGEENQRDRETEKHRERYRDTKTHTRVLMRARHVCPNMLLPRTRTHSRKRNLDHHIFDMRTLTASWLCRTRDPPARRSVAFPTDIKARRSWHRKQRTGPVTPQRHHMGSGPDTTFGLTWRVCLEDTREKQSISILQRPPRASVRTVHIIVNCFLNCLLHSERYRSGVSP